MLFKVMRRRQKSLQRSFMMVFLLLALMSCAFIAGESRELNNAKRVKASMAEEERKEICIENLGCYPETDPEHVPTGYFERFSAWVGETIDDEWWRSTREHIGTQFRYWGPNRTTVEVINNYNFHVHITETSGYNPDLKTYFIIHGYHGGNAPWAVQIKDLLQHKEPCNVFIVDWSEGGGILYGTAAANTWVVGAEIGRFIERIVLLTGMKPRKVHLIGHSLGAHTAGFAGKWLYNKLKRKVGRITGLDPAGPDFDDVVPGERLDRSDAAFVDVIHTNYADNALAGLGIYNPIGHFDFYPNGGEDQPGCPTAGEAELEIGEEIMEYINPTYKIIVLVNGDDKTIEDAFDGLACSHGRAYAYFIESLQDHGCQFLADQCTSWQDYLDGKCPPGSGDNMRVPMGYDSKKFRKFVDWNSQRSFFLRTNTQPPYCIP